MLEQQLQALFELYGEKIVQDMRTKMAERTKTYRSVAAQSQPSRTPPPPCRESLGAVQSSTGVPTGQRCDRGICHRQLYCSRSPRIPPAGCRDTVAAQTEQSLSTRLPAPTRARAGVSFVFRESVSAHRFCIRYFL